MLRRGKGGAHGSSKWTARDGAASRHGGGAVPAAFVNIRSQGTGLMSLGQGRSDHPCSQGGSWKEGGRHEAGGGDEEGEEGPVDGLLVWARLGEKRKLSFLHLNSKRQR